jgi:regulator of protease activity HflC (stomatin/prohibitin superfamily)
MIIVAVAVMARVLWSLIVQRIVVRSGFVGLLYRDEKLETVLPPGGYWRWRIGTRMTLIDTRRSVLSLKGQEILTRDRVALKLSATGTYEIVDPQRAVSVVSDYNASMYAIVQQALRAVVAEIDVEDALNSRAAIAMNAERRATESLAEIGIRLQSFELKDVMLTGDLKRGFAAVLRARQDAQVAMEQARGEAAVLRCMANAAKLIESSPALMNLRWLQTAVEMGRSSGNTLVMGAPLDPKS